MAAKVGSIVLATEQGLGYLAKDFFDNGIINKVLIHEHSTRTNHREWYPRESIVSSVEELLESCDTLLFFETPFNWKVIPQAREKGIKTIFVPMFECTPFPFPYQPDLVLSPSALDRTFYPDSTQVTIPVSAHWKERSRATVFVHNSGNGGLGGRNGTKEVIEAWKHVKSPAKLILRSQVPIVGNVAISMADPRIDCRIGSFENIWEEGDVFLFPEKFNGLSLPLQEAFASGMLIMCGDRFPMNTWLPKEPLIPVAKYTKERLAVEFECAQFDPVEIARCVDNWYNKDITSYSLLGKAWGETNAWNKLRGRYEELMLPFSEAAAS